MKTFQLGPWSKGMVNTVQPQAVPADALLDGVNVDIGREGSISSRTAWTRIDSAAAHSLFEHNGIVYGVVAGEVGLLADAGFTPLMPVQGRLSWTVLNGQAVFSDYAGVYVVTPDGALTLPADIGDDEAELALAPIPGGQWICYWRGRLLVARGTTLFFSEPMRYGVYDQLRNFIAFEERISWLAPLEGGVYVGLRNSVRYLRGDSPADWTQIRSAGPSWLRSGAVVGTSLMDERMVQGAEYVALWMSEKGFAVGLPSGEVVYPQADRLKGIPIQEGCLVVLGDRVTVLSN